MSDRCMIPIVKSPKDYQAYRISPHDTNRLALVFDPDVANASITVCLEIFDIGGKTPPNRHQLAVEMFFIIKGEGVASCDGKQVNIQAGDSILVPPTGTHMIENTGSTRLYALCIMVPNEDFAELIRRGIPVELDEEDLTVLTRVDGFAAASMIHLSSV
ncbi:cupin domain-containing protein [Limnoraphis robusta Tam1]|uniref:Cupin domain-containing protein n=1 Tax=Limnoraphis robusta CCNP1315 TaxID=3110306 RepID=A0ABU5U5X7_9CYAN|nr:cupin domain-containing protein [Limnoraphis robusta]MEA5496788.1 cupin domain-containing protein [Limnoraphis robusta BA-68 BA1]MEA5522390.1 cupin domain-containing protein [Limnoraphis robusta CCNP1315]MEA5541530.1 cupin domain-containing protein [Limnoraphis robusta Tam1]MEA5546149.1 cupin domain-containing protein [Limnoraphis robusta CCNP1324]